MGEIFEGAVVPPLFFVISGRGVEGTTVGWVALVAFPFLFLFPFPPVPTALLCEVSVITTCQP